MIINLLLNAVAVFFGALISFMPVVTFCDVGDIGPVTCEYMLLAVSKWNSFMITFPYAQIAWHVFLYVILPFEFVLLVVKFFLGQRTPTNNAN